MKLSNEIKTGILVLTGIVLFIIGFSYLKSNDVFITDRIFYAVYDDVEGVSKAEVTFETKLAVVTFDDEKTTVKALTEATTNAGYPSTLKE